MFCVFFGSLISDFLFWGWFGCGWGILSKAGFSCCSSDHSPVLPKNHRGAPGDRWRPRDVRPKGAFHDETWPEACLKKGGVKRCSKTKRTISNNLRPQIGLPESSCVSLLSFWPTSTFVTFFTFCWASITLTGWGSECCWPAGGSASESPKRVRKTTAR